MNDQLLSQDGCKMPIQKEVEMAPELLGLGWEPRSWARHAGQHPNPAPMCALSSYAYLLLPVPSGS